MTKIITAEELAGLDVQLDEVRAAVAHGDASHNPWALQALAVADRLRQALEDIPRHIIDFRATGWTLKHPLACRPNLFACPVNWAAEGQNGPPPGLGQFECEERDGVLVVGNRVDGTASDARP